MDAANAIREVTTAMHNAYDKGEASAAIDLWDLIEALNAIADKLDDK